MIVTTGLNKVRDWLYGDIIDDPTHIGFGTTTASPALGNTALGGEVMPTTSRHLAEKAKGEFNVVYDIFVAATEANGETLAEVGLFDANTGGVMFVRLTHPDIVKTASQTVPYFININIPTHSPGLEVFGADGNGFPISFLGEQF